MDLRGNDYMAVIPLSDITLESKVAFLRLPSSFPEPTYRIETVETHMSWVFLTENFAYKLKKPVCYMPLDFRTLESRRFYCEEEVRLNRRLAAGIYLGVKALTVDAQHHLHLDGPGIPIDWLVKMRRLPANQMLDYAIRTGKASDRDVEAIAARLAVFYRECDHIEIDPMQYRDRLWRNLNAYRQELTNPAYQLSSRLVDRIASVLEDILENDGPLFNERVAGKHIVEGHGDLRPEHICLRPNLAIIDCLEFSHELRITDTADELAFLALECARLGSAGLGLKMLDSFSRISGDRIPEKLVRFYQTYRALLRAAIAIRHLKEEKFRYSPHWRQRAKEYLALAEGRIEGR